MKEKKEIAAALKYDSKKGDAPVILAKGQGNVAKRIMDVAERTNVPTYKDEKLAKQLMNLTVGQEIPPDLYRVVAEVLAFVINLDELRGCKDESV